MHDIMFLTSKPSPNQILIPKKNYDWSCLLGTPPNGPRDGQWSPHLCPDNLPSSSPSWWSKGHFSTFVNLLIVLVVWLHLIPLTNSLPSICVCVWLVFCVSLKTIVPRKHFLLFDGKKTLDQHNNAYIYIYIFQS